MPGFDTILQAIQKIRNNASSVDCSNVALHATTQDEATALYFALEDNTTLVEIRLPTLACFIVKSLVNKLVTHGSCLRYSEKAILGGMSAARLFQSSTDSK
jgi:hypothetical protein